MSGLGRNAALDATPLSVFDRIVAQLNRTRAAKIIPLHQGKTVYTTPVELREWKSDEFDHVPYHDGPSSGTETLIEAIRMKLQSQFGETVDPTRIQVTCGITHGLSIALHCILQPGDEVIVLSPQWLFTNGLVRAAQGIPVEVPFFPVGDEEGVVDVAACIEPYLTSKTRAIYFNSPNNPTGCSLTLAQMSQIAEIARRFGLWMLSDNAYEYYDYSAGGFVDPIMLPCGRDNTFSAYSFSKSFGLTGYRIGYLLSPPAMMESARKFGLYSIYSVPTCCQFVAVSAMRNGAQSLERHRSFIKDALELTVSRLRVPARRPDGGFYVFLDLAEWRAGVDDFIGRCISEGVSLAPGSVFGERYDGCARLCYSVVCHDDLAEGIDIINRVFQEGD